MANFKAAWGARLEYGERRPVARSARSAHRPMPEFKIVAPHSQNKMTGISLMSVQDPQVSHK
jgi:hypothetical protein